MTQFSPYARINGGKVNYLTIEENGVMSVIASFCGKAVMGGYVYFLPKTEADWLVANGLGEYTKKEE